LADILLDTDILIDATKLRPSVVSVIRSFPAPSAIGLSTVTLFEFLVGAHDADRILAFRRLIRDFQVFDLTSEAAERAAEVDRILRAAGLRIDTADCLIAGVALANGLPLLTRNLRHFERIPGLDVQTI
jgi:tRNA(fMet)-specific endonuclease VapC